jgi:hypothetical protein
MFRPGVPIVFTHTHMYIRQNVGYDDDTEPEHVADCSLQINLCLDCKFTVFFIYMFKNYILFMQLKQTKKT